VSGHNEPVPITGELDVDQFNDAVKHLAPAVDDALAGWADITDREFTKAGTVHAAVVEILTRMTPTDPFERDQVATAILDAIVEVMNQ
jgi:hypothetical protein